MEKRNGGRKRRSGIGGGGEGNRKGVEGHAHPPSLFIFVPIHCLSFRAHLV